LFALTRDDSRRVVRFSLSAEIQKDIEEMFKQQEAAFGQDALDKISFDGKYKPDEGECLIIDDYEGAEQFYYAIANPLSVPTIRPSAEDFENIKAIFSGRIDAGKNLALIESFDKKNSFDKGIRYIQ
jgi:hypothetical protein